MDDPMHREVPITLHSPPGDVGRIAETGYIADTPENRRLLEDAAIPRCREWREANPEYRMMWRKADGTETWYVVNDVRYRTPENLHPAPYCCSAYCDRCAGLRALNGDDPALLPNEWLDKA